MTYPAFPKPTPSVKNKKMKVWNNTRNELKLDFKTRGITTCELRLPDCWGDDALGFAHADKRRNIVGDDIKKVIVACGSCHAWLERQKRAYMTDLVELVIKHRK